MAYTPIYTPVNFVDWAPPDIDAENLNAIEDALVSLGNGLQTAAADTDTNTADIAAIDLEIAAISNLIEEMLPVDSVSGNPAVITDAFGGAAKSLKLTLEPIQSGSGTPSPANPRPIIGRTQNTATRSGKNFYSKTPLFVRSGCTQSNYSVAKSDVTFTAASGFFGNSGQGTLSDQNPDKMVTVEAGKEYSVSLHLLSSAPAGLELKCYIQFFDMFGKNATSWQTSTGSSYTFTVPAGKSKVAFNCMFSNATIGTTVTIGFQIEGGDTATDWEAYNGESITEAYGQTLYGASVDVTAGDAKNKWGYIEFDGSNDENWTKFESGSASAFAMIISVPNGETNTVDNSNIKCDKLASISTSATWGSFDLWVSLYVSSIVIGVQSVTTVSDLRTWLSNNPLHIVYKYATPADIPLTSQNLALLKGDNVIATDADNVDVEYSADIKLYINKMLGTSSSDTRSAKSSGASEEETKTIEEKTIEPEEAKK